MATTADIEKLIDSLRGQIKTHKQILERTRDPAKTVPNVEAQLSDLEKRYADVKQKSGDLAPIECLPRPASGAPVITLVAKMILFSSQLSNLFHPY